MSSSDTTGLPPQTGAEGPNPLELFFEKNKKWIYTFAMLLVAALGVNYGMQKLDRAEINRDWGEFTAVSGLASGFSSSVKLEPLPEQYKKFQAQIWGQTLATKQQELVTKLMDDIRGADIAKIDEQIAASKDHTKVPWLIWVAANKLYTEGDWDGARARCNTLKTDHAKHFLCSESPYPMQLRKEKEDPDKKKDDEKKKKKKKKADLVGAVPGIPVDNLLAAIAKDQKFINDNPQYFTAPETDKAETVVFTLSGVDLAGPVEIEIGFFPEAAKHVAAFKKSIAEGYYKDMRVYKIKRAQKGKDDDKAPRTIHIGHPNSKDENRDKWTEVVDAKEEDILEFESGKKRLSFFPLMVAAEQEKDGKSSGRRFFITANDCASQYDGDYVIFGRVIRGGQYIQDIVSGDMLDETEENAGEGRPVEDIQVVSSELKKK